MMFWYFIFEPCKQHYIGNVEISAKLKRIKMQGGGAEIASSLLEMQDENASRPLSLTENVGLLVYL